MKFVKLLKQDLKVIGMKLANYMHEIYEVIEMKFKICEVISMKYQFKIIEMNFSSMLEV